jgi:hypothetical protein
VDNKQQRDHNSYGSDTKASKVDNKQQRDRNYIYITSMKNCHLIILHVLYKQLSSPFNNEYVMYIYTH